MRGPSFRPARKQTFALVPTDVVKCRMQAGAAGLYAGPLDCTRQARTGASARPAVSARTARVR